MGCGVIGLGRDRRVVNVVVVIGYGVGNAGEGSHGWYCMRVVVGSSVGCGIGVVGN